jgi:hypothetical protein
MERCRNIKGVFSFIAVVKCKKGRLFLWSINGHYGTCTKMSHILERSKTIIRIILVEHVKYLENVFLAVIQSLYRYICK